MCMYKHIWIWRSQNSEQLMLKKYHTPFQSDLNSTSPRWNRREKFWTRYFHHRGTLVFFSHLLLQGFLSLLVFSSSTLAGWENLQDFTERMAKTFKDGAKRLSLTYFISIFELRKLLQKHCGSDQFGGICHLFHKIINHSLWQR